MLADLAQRGVEAKAYMPAIHLMRHMRERFGFRAGQFPVAEDASERLLALPFFPAISRGRRSTASARRWPRRCGGTGRERARRRAWSSTELERRFLDRASRAATGEVDGPMERHCVRCFLFVRAAAAERRGVEIDREVVLCAAFLHDAGLYDSISHGGVYTDECGARASALFAEAGEPGPSGRGSCADACAQHHALRRAVGARGRGRAAAARRPDRGQRRALTARASAAARCASRSSTRSRATGFYTGRRRRCSATRFATRPLTLPRIFKLA